MKSYEIHVRYHNHGKQPNFVTPHRITERHGGAVGSALGFGSKHPSSKLGRDNCVEALSPHRVTAVGKLLTLNCLGGDWPSFTFILTLLSSDCGLSVVSNKRILLKTML